MKKIITYWFWPVLWMVIIFVFSSRTRIGVSEKYLINFIFFKLLHIVEYTILYLLLFRAFYSHFPKNNKALIYAALSTLLFAISDEIHQSLVPTRQGTLRDIGIDTLGIILGFMYTKNNLKKLLPFL